MKIFSSTLMGLLFSFFLSCSSENQGVDTAASEDGSSAIPNSSAIVGISSINKNSQSELLSSTESSNVSLKSSTIQPASSVGDQSSDGASSSVEVLSSMDETSSLVGISSSSNLDKVATPVASIVGGVYRIPQNVVLTTSTIGAKIYYTTDGGVPSIASTEYKEPIKIGNDVTIKAIAVLENYADSETLSERYDFQSYCEAIPANCSSFEDLRDNQVYKTVKIGSQTWMAENLNYDANGSFCYEATTSNCDIYGRLYTWFGAMDGSLSSPATPSGVQGVCPDGWHIPSANEWKQLADFIQLDAGLTGSNSTSWVQVGKLLKSKSSLWETDMGVDYYDFNAEPSGNRLETTFEHIAQYSFWWTSTEYRTADAYFINTFHHHDDLFRDYNNKTRFFYSVRCVKD